MAVGAAVQAQEPLRVSVNDPRPLMAVLDQLEKRFGWVLTYEDPPYVHPSDLQEQAEYNGQPANPSRASMPIPRGGAFTFAYPMADDPMKVRDSMLTALLQDYGLTARTPGAFTLPETPGVVHIVPSRMKNSRGEIESRGSILSTRIQVAPGTRTVYALIQDVADALGGTIGTKVGLFSLPQNLRMNTNVEVLEHATESSARAMLLRALNATNRKLSWRLVFSPGQPRMYMLSIHPVAEPKQTGSQH